MVKAADATGASGRPSVRRGIGSRVVGRGGGTWLRASQVPATTPHESARLTHLPRPPLFRSGILCSAPEQEFQAVQPPRLPWTDARRGMSPASCTFMLQETTHEFQRWTGVAMATAVVAYGLSRRSMSGVAMAAAAAPIAFRGVTGAWPGFANGASDTRTALAGNRGIHVREAIRLEV